MINRIPYTILYKTIGSFYIFKFCNSLVVEAFIYKCLVTLLRKEIYIFSCNSDKVKDMISSFIITLLGTKVLQL